MKALRRTPALVASAATIAGLLAGGLLALLHGVHPLEAIRVLVQGALACPTLDRCNLLVTFQFSTPLILTGLSAAVAMQSGLFSLGQAGQMVLGAAVAAFAVSRGSHPPLMIVPAAIIAASAAGAVWSGLAGLLRAHLGVSEVLSTLLMNPLAFLIAGMYGYGRIPAAYRLPPLLPHSKLTLGLPLALALVPLTSLFLRRATRGLEQRMGGESPGFARGAGMPVSRILVRAMVLSGAFSGLAGAVETLGVHYRFVSNFAAGGGFDGIVVAALGQLHPLGVTAASLLLASIRVGALTGLQLVVNIPRELGNAMIALILLAAGLGMARGDLNRILGPTQKIRAGRHDFLSPRG